MKTSAKIAAARALSATVRSARALVGASNQPVCERGGFNWALDLREGIDLSLFTFGRFEPEVVDASRTLVRAGGVVLDIGANIGVHTLPFADLVGESGAVYAFEPTDYAYGKLLRNIALNPRVASRIRTRQALLLAGTEEQKPAGVWASWPLGDDGDVHAVHKGSLKSIDGAAITTLDRELDALGVRSVDLIKLDVDGHELPVLEGGRAFLTAHRPPIVSEFAPYLYQEFGYSFGELTNCLTALGYECRLLPSCERVAYETIPARAGAGGGVNVLLQAAA